MTQITLTEVICTPDSHKAASHRHAFGQTFHDHATATRYARAMRRKGYTADISPTFWTQPDLETALRSASDFYEDASLTEPQP